jgi:membrane-associated protease RseP (regulator of RpoE activity)
MNHPFDTWFWQAGYAQQWIAYAAGLFVWISVFWGVLNWVPIGGLDGSHMVREIAIRRNPLRGAEIARGISIVASVAAFLYLYSRGYRIFAFLVVIWALPSLTNRGGMA